MAQVTARGMSPRDAATYLGLAESTLRKQRCCSGNRPGGMTTVPYVRAGRRVLYLRDQLDAWLQACGTSPERVVS